MSKKSPKIFGSNFLLQLPILEISSKWDVETGVKTGCAESKIFKKLFDRRFLCYLPALQTSSKSNVRLPKY